MFLTFVIVMFRNLEFFPLGFLRKSLWGFPEEQIQLALAASFLSSRSLASAISRARLWDLYVLRASPRLGFPRLVLLRLSSALFLAVLSLSRFAPLALTWNSHVCCAKFLILDLTTSHSPKHSLPEVGLALNRSEERRVGKEC